MTDANQKELVLSPNQYAYIRDLNKGTINTWCGPHKVTLSNTDELVVFDRNTKKFTPTDIEKAKQLCTTAPENWYVILKNPAKDGQHPTSNTTVAELNIGRKVNVLGPCNFALFPGQMAKVVRGHMLRSNQYLMVRVYDAESAMANWDNGVAKSANGEEVKAVVTTPKLVVGQILVIKGTDVSFYIPPTGIEVLPEAEDKYVREAITLERLEYCILKDEDGNKRYVQGPSVVFPTPTEQFVKGSDGKIKYRAYELNEISGIYVKVIADYEEGGKAFKTGDELFITGKDTAIYFPRAEHAIISYGDADVINYAIAIPEGDGRYVLNRMTGEIATKIGPCMFLPDPRKEVIVKRVLSPSQASLWFPGNQKVKEYNDNLRGFSKSVGYVAQNDYLHSVDCSASVLSFADNSIGSNTGFSRNSNFTKPRTVTLHSQDYDGVVSIDIWTGYAIKVVDKTGNSKVVVGPTTYLLKYDETLEVLELSTGKPKTTDNLMKTVFLRVKNNKVSDLVQVETKDFCNVEIKLSYNVEFMANDESDKLKWFDADNYVKLLCDRMKSVVRRQVKRLTIDEFYTNAADIITASVLGVEVDKLDVNMGRIFPQNNMRVFDVEVIYVRINDNNINELFEENQHEVISKQLELINAGKKAEITKALAEFAKSEQEVAFDLKTKEVELQIDLAEKLSTAQMNKLIAEQTLDEAKTNFLKTQTEKEHVIRMQKLATEKAANDDAIEYKTSLAELDADRIEKQTAAFVEKMKSVSPGLIEALTALSETGHLVEVAKSVAPYALAGGDESVSDVVRKLLMKDTSLNSIISMVTKQD